MTKYLRRFEIPLRHEDQGHKSRSQLGYGEAWRKRQVVVHRREQEIIERMRKLRNEGWSYGKIAGVLNAWGIRTKTGKGKWTAKQVHQILVRIEEAEKWNSS